MYDKLDELIVQAIEKRKNPLHESRVCGEATRLARATSRESFRIIDGRMQALRKRGVIVWLTKAEAKGIGGCLHVREGGHPAHPW
jgi:hypothetical protein